MNQPTTSSFLFLLILIILNSSFTSYAQTRTQLVNTNSKYESSASSPQASAQVYQNDDGIGHLHHRHVLNGGRSSSMACPACLDARLIQHYHVRGCTAVTLGHCTCPSRFKCPVDVPASRSLGHGKNSRSIRGGQSSLEQANNGRSLKLTSFAGNGLSPGGCLYNSTHFTLGQIVPTSDKCRICVCGYLSDGTLGIDCETSIQCPTTRSSTPPVPNVWMTNQAGQLVSSFLGRTLGGQLSPVKVKLLSAKFFIIYNFKTYLSSTATTFSSTTSVALVKSAFL